MTDLKKLIPKWGTPAMSVYDTELACTNDIKTWEQ